MRVCARKCVSEEDPERDRATGNGEGGGGGNVKYIAEAMKDAIATAPQA